MGIYSSRIVMTTLAVELLPSANADVLKPLSAKKQAFLDANSSMVCVRRTLVVQTGTLLYPVKHEGPFDWEMILKYYEPEILTIEGFLVRASASKFFDLCLSSAKGVTKHSQIFGRVTS